MRQQAWKILLQARLSEQVAKIKDSAITPKARCTISKKKRRMERKRCGTTIETQFKTLRDKTTSNPSTTKKKVKEGTSQAMPRRDSEETTTTRRREF